MQPGLGARSSRSLQMRKYHTSGSNSQFAVAVHWTDLALKGGPTPRFEDIVRQGERKPIFFAINAAIPGGNSLTVL